MPWKQRVLVVANVTAGSPELLSALRERAERAPTAIHLVVPATPLGGGREIAVRTLEDALARLRDAGLEADGVVGHPDPFVAVAEAWDPKRYDEIIVSTLPMRVSKWLHAGLPERIQRATGALVTHVVSQPPPHALSRGVPVEHQQLGIFTPLSVLGWGRSRGASPARSARARLRSEHSGTS
jgi:GABA permease